MNPKDTNNSKNCKIFDPSKSVEHKLPTPQPLEVEEKEALQYPVAMLGEVLGNAAQAMHEDVKAPLAQCGQSLLAAASLMAQPFYNIKPPYGSVFPLSLFAITSGGSGDRKSTVYGIALKPIRELEEELREEHAELRKAYKMDVEAYEQTKKQVIQTNKKKPQGEIRAALLDECEEPVPPLSPYLVSEDPTIEGLFRSLNEGQPAQGIFTDEGAMLIGGHALNGDNKLKTAGRLSKAWDGSPFDRTRGGEDIGKLYNRRIAMHIMAQPSVLHELLKQEDLVAQGFLARFLITCPESMAGKRFTDKAAPIKNPYHNKAVIRYLKVMKCLATPNEWPRKEGTPQELEPKELMISPDAYALYVDTANMYEGTLGRLGSLDHLRPVVSRFMEQALRIAGVLMCVDKGAHETEIGTEYLKRGIALAQHSLSTWEELKNTSNESEPLNRAQLLLDWLHDDGCEFVYSMQISQFAPNSLRKKTARDSAIKTLVEHGWLYVIEGGKNIDNKHRKLVWKVMQK